MEHRIQLSCSLQPSFLPIKEGLAYQMTRFSVKIINLMLSFDKSKNQDGGFPLFCVMESFSALKGIKCSMGTSGA